MSKAPRRRPGCGPESALLGAVRATPIATPADREIPEIGDELTAARALSDLAHRLLSTATADIEVLPASVRGWPRD